MLQTPLTEALGIEVPLICGAMYPCSNAELVAAAVRTVVNLCGDRYILFCGVDDLAMEAAMLGAVGWVAGLVNAFPHETVRLWKLIAAGRWDEARTLYRWFTPALHLDCHVKLVQYIKLAQAMAGLGTETVRSPRMTLEGAERQKVADIVQRALDSRSKAAAE